ncbi:FtsK/SpoIIIE domain-containing protein [Actinoalloteichus hymeniacidonis]|uniref:FtsK/SpoIIIE family protein n=1 Tax=Actinoalloteichus hymeniacidonis TaxID=340345 RepID=A0AAC9N0W1_9PSEU|nr:FtsK/SpoIIIE domain-containing protein [Actinoalloteichus hymeniacidonis]AOS65790.1 FtsK/SpoIIIE family protein [Actinoalloteichus hymeniacidonis]MBB5906119.1 DNA polymerase III delta prime subunit [Actinoalloteichus hymeniacidonis]
MNRRDERRRRITEAFEDFRSTVARALGVAVRQHTTAHQTHAERVFELWLRDAGVDRAMNDPELAVALRNPALQPVVQRAAQDRDQHFAGWTGTMPAELTELVATASPGSASAPYPEWLGQPGKRDGSSEDGGVPELWRIGTAVMDSAPVPEPFPVAVPLLDGAHLHITSSPESRVDAENLVETLLLRVLSYFQPGLVQVHVWDVGALTGSLPGLYPLTRAGLLTVHDPARLHDLLDEFAEHIRRIHTSVLVDGRRSIGALQSDTGRRGEPWRVAVLFGNRSALKEEDQQKLQRIARNGLSCGVQLIIVDLPITVNSAVETLRLDDDQTARCSMTGPQATVYLDPGLPREKVPRACNAIADELLARRSRVCSFDDLLPNEPWTYHSAAGLQTPIGYADGDPIYVSLGDGSPHALIGGPSGSGKTNLLYALLGGLAARYSPNELEFYVLDFKEGVSFAQFAPGRRDPSWLPHARLVGVNVNQDREFGVALLRYLSEEMRRRAERAKQHEVTKLEELRIEDPHGRWPRIVAVIDEFQYLFADRDEVTNLAAALLEDVARRGRSQGIHLVLSSQDISGIEAFWGKPAIFEQFTVRIALPKARRVLTEVNQTAMEIPRRHAVINHDSGVPHGNEVARIPDATARGTSDRLQIDLWERRPSNLTEPRLFDGSNTPMLRTLPDYLRLAPPDAAHAARHVPRALLGQVIDMAGSGAVVPLAASPGRNIAVLGSVLRDATSVLASAALSLARQYEPGAVEFTIVSLIDDPEDTAADLAAELRRAKHTVEFKDGHQVRKLIDKTAQSLKDRLESVENSENSEPGPHYLLLFGMDSAHPRLESRDPGLGRTGLDSLRLVLKHGPELHTHVIGWWRSTGRLKAALAMGGLDDIGAWVAFDVHGQELGSLAANQVITWSPRPRRGLFFDRFHHAKPQVVIPCDADVPAQPVDRPDPAE